MSADFHCGCFLFLLQNINYETSELQNDKWSQVSKRVLTDDTDQHVLLRRPIRDIAFDTLGVIPIRYALYALINLCRSPLATE